VSHLNPIIEFYIDEDFVYVRFENMNEQQLNDEIREFKRRFPDRRWLRSANVWQVPKNNVQKIALFAYERFGPDTLLPIKPPDLPQQLELPLT